MSSYPMRDQLTDHLLTPKNTALLIIDFQPVQIASIESIDKKQLMSNIVIVAQMAMHYKIPVVLSSVNVSTGLNKPVLSQLQAALPGIQSLDRTTINAWEDKDFFEAVAATGRKKLLICALWTEACLTFPALDAMKEGFEVYTVVDAIGGTSTLAHETGLRRIEQAGARLTSIGQLGCELQRDWNRADTAPFMVEAFVAAGIFLDLG
jgi:nicotinamidase-related amidase